MQVPCKTLNYKGYKLHYQVISGSCFGQTYFYYGYEEVKRRKYWLFGPIISEQFPKLLAFLNFNIEDYRYSKNYVHNKLDEIVVLLERKIEIENGIIVDEKR